MSKFNNSLSDSENEHNVCKETEMLWTSRASSLANTKEAPSLTTSPLKTGIVRKDYKLFAILHEYPYDHRKQLQTHEAYEARTPRSMAQHRS